MSLGDIFNGAVGYIRANPKATLGLTAAVVVVMQIATLMLQLGPLVSRQPSAMDSAQPSAAVLPVWPVDLVASAIATGLAGILLSGMLTVIIGRAVFGSTITIDEAWAKIRGRLLALIALAALEAAGAALVIGVVVLVIAAVAAIGGGAAAVLLGFPLVLATIAAVAYLYTILSFAPVVIVLERRNVIDAITRSVGLVRNSFWRVLGIRLLTGVVVVAITGAVAAPFTLIGQLLVMAAASTGPLLIGATLGAIGSAIGQIITAPFSAGVVVLLYTDRRIRAEAFDLVLQTGAAAGRYATMSTDDLWLARPI